MRDEPSGQSGMSAGPPAVREPRAARAQRFFFGDDIFVSYSRHDSDYALALADELTRRKLSCFLDQWGTPAGEELPTELVERLKKSTMLVIVGTERAAASENVMKEVVEFNKTKRPIIPITFVEEADFLRIRNNDLPENLKGTLEGAGWYSEIAGIARTFESKARLKPQPPDDKVEPSDSVITRIVNAKGFLSRSKRLRKAFWTTFASLLTILITVGVVALVLIVKANAKVEQAYAQQRTAEAQAVHAQQIQLGAERARDDAVKARERAEGETKKAQDDLVIAQSKAEAAREKQQLAEAKTRRAETLEREAKERAASASRLEEGTRASVLARTPGRDFDALELAARAARQEFSVVAQPAAQIVDGLVAAVSAADDGIPLSDAPGAVTFTQISPDGRAVFAETYGGGVVRWGVWDARTGALLMSLQTPRLKYEVNDMTLPQGAYTMPAQKIFMATFSGDASRLAVIDKDFRLWVWAVGKYPATTDVEKPEPPLLSLTNGSNVNAVSLNDDGSRLLILSGFYGDSAKLMVVDTEKAIHLRDFDAASVETFDVSGATPGDFVELAGFARDGEPVLCFSSRQHRTLYFARTKEVRDLKVPNTGVLGFDDKGLPIFMLDPRKDRAGVAGLPADAPQKIILSEGERRREFSGYSGDISSAAVVGERAYVVTIYGGQARVHGARADEGFVTLRGHTGGITRAVLSPDGKRAAVASGEALLWDMRTGAPLHRLAFSGGDVDSVSAAAFSADGSRLAMTHDSLIPEVWDIPAGDGERPRNLTPGCGALKLRPGHLDPASKTDWPMAYRYQPKAVAFLPDAQGLTGKQRLVTMHVGGYIAVWESGKCHFEKEHPLFHAGEHSMVVALSADGATALTLGNKNSPVDVGDVEANSVSLWNLRGLAETGGVPVKSDDGDLGTLPAGKFLAAYVRGRDARVLLLKNDGQLELWRPGPGGSLKLGRGAGAVRSAFFSSDGSKLAILLRDRSFNKAVAMEIWDAGVGKRLISIPGDYDLTSGIYGNPAVLSDDGSRLLVGYKDHTVRVYPTTPRGFLDVANRILRGNRVRLRVPPRHVE